MEGYSTKYSTSFYDTNGDLIKISIQEKGNTVFERTAITLDNTPVVITKNSDGILDNICGTGCKINLINNNDNFLFFNDIFAKSEREHYVSITKNTSTYLFEGFILPEIYSQSISRNARITIPANDQLSSLREKYSDILSNIEVNYVNMMDILKEAIWNTGIKRPIYVKNGIYNKHYTDFWDSSTCVFENAWFDKNLFLEDGFPKNQYEVIEQILKTFYSRLYYYDGKWFIDRLKNIETLNEYTVYTYDGSVYSTVYDWPDIKIEEKYIIADSGTMNYEAGKKTYEMALNFDLFDNMVNPYFVNITKDPSQYNFSINPEFGNYGITYPPKYQWFVNNDNAVFFQKNFSDSVINTGLLWYANPGRYNTDNVHQKNTFISTKLVLDYDTTSELNISYKISMGALKTIENNTTYRSTFSLRYTDPNAPKKTRWLYLDASDNLNVTDNITLPYNHFITLKTGAAIKEQDNPNLFAVEKSIPIGDVMPYIKSTLSPLNDLEFVELYLDVHLFSIIPTSEFFPTTTAIGDFLVTYKRELEENVIIATLDNDFRGKMNLELDLFDYSSANLKNTILLRDGSTSFVKAKQWYEYGFDRKKDVQLMYLTDVIQLYNKPRYRLDADVLMKGVSPDFGNVYTYSLMLDASNNESRFICTGYDYNVLKNAYSLELQEWVDYDGYYVAEDQELPGVETLYITPSDGSVYWWGGYGGIDISTNTDWFAEVSTGSQDWIQLYNSSGFGNGTIMYNAGYNSSIGSRYGYIYVKTDTLSETFTLFQGGYGDEEPF